MRFFCMISQAPGLIFPLKIEPLFLPQCILAEPCAWINTRVPLKHLGPRGWGRDLRRLRPHGRGESRLRISPPAPRLQQDCRVEDAAGSLIAGCTSLADILLFGRPDRLPGPGGLAPARQSDSKSYHPILALCSDAAPVQDDDLLGNGQPQPRAPGA